MRSTRVCGGSFQTAASAFFMVENVVPTGGDFSVLAPAIEPG
jgi:hypothetical protein